MSHSRSNSSQVSGVIALMAPGPLSFMKISMMGDAESPSSQSPSTVGNSSADSWSLSLTLFWRRTAALIALHTTLVDGSPSFSFCFLAAAALPLDDDWDDGRRCIGILLLFLFFFVLDDVLLRKEEEEEERTARVLVLFFCLDIISNKEFMKTNQTRIKTWRDANQ